MEGTGQKIESRPRFDDCLLCMASPSLRLGSGRNSPIMYVPLKPALTTRWPSRGDPHTTSDGEQVLGFVRE